MRTQYPSLGIGILTGTVLLLVCGIEPAHAAKVCYPAAANDAKVTHCCYWESSGTAGGCLDRPGTYYDAHPVGSKSCSLACGGASRANVSRLDQGVLVVNIAAPTTGRDSGLNKDTVQAQPRFDRAPAGFSATQGRGTATAPPTIAPDCGQAALKLCLFKATGNAQREAWCNETFGSASTAAPPPNPAPSH